MSIRRCEWHIHAVSRRDNRDGTVTLALEAARYTSNTERRHGDTATCRWCKQPIHRDGPAGWQAATPGNCPDAGKTLPYHSPGPLPGVVRASEPCMVRTVPARYTDRDGERRQVMECEDAGAMVAGHLGDPYTVVWQGRGWTAEIRSGYPLWQMTG